MSGTIFIFVVIFYFINFNSNGLLSETFTFSLPLYKQFIYFWFFDYFFYWISEEKTLRKKLQNEKNMLSCKSILGKLRYFLWILNFRHWTLFNVTLIDGTTDDLFLYRKHVIFFLHYNTMCAVDKYIAVQHKIWCCSCRFAFLSNKRNKM